MLYRQGGRAKDCIMVFVVREPILNLDPLKTAERRHACLSRD